MGYAARAVCCAFCTLQGSLLGSANYCTYFEEVSKHVIRSILTIDSYCDWDRIIRTSKIMLKERESEVLSIRTFTDKETQDRRQEKPGKLRSSSAVLVGSESRRGHVFDLVIIIHRRSVLSICGNVWSRSQDRVSTVSFHST